MRFARRFAVLVWVAFVSTVVPAGAASLGGARWTQPVTGPVVREFDPPETRFGPGHLGVDFAAAPKTPVRAAGGGVVVFAGRVGTALHVVIRHAGDIRTSYSFLASISVVTGQSVVRGAVVGTSGGTGPGHGAGVVHFGVRIGAGYIDPMRLFTPVDLAAVVHLARPHGGPAGFSPEHAPAGSGEERRTIVGALRVDAHPPAPPPVWWAARPDDAMRPDDATRSDATAPESRSAGVAHRFPTNRPTNSSPPVIPAIGVAALSAGGLAAARRRRLGRDQSRGVRLHSNPAR